MSKDKFTRLTEELRQSLNELHRYERPVRCDMNESLPYKYSDPTITIDEEGEFVDRFEEA